VEEIDFGIEKAADTNLVVRKEPELMLPTDFDVRVGRLRTDVERAVRYAEEALKDGITRLDQHDHAVEVGRLLQIMTKNVADFYKPIKQAIDQLKQPILDMEHEDVEALKTAKEKLGSLILDYEKRVADLEARLLAQAQAQAASEAKDGAIASPVIVQSAGPQKTRGKVERETWRAEVADIMKLVKEVAAERVPVAAILPNQSYLNKRADADREAFNIPGVVAHKVEKVHFRA
jgi:hypothetical protein